MTFKKRKLGARIWADLKEGDELDPKKAILVKEHAITLDLTVARDLTSANISIFGLPRDLMIRLTMFAKTFKPAGWVNNHLEVFIYDEKEGIETIVFGGQMITCFADFNVQPNVNLLILAQSAYMLRMKQSAVSFEGTHTVGEMMDALCGDVGYTFVPVPKEIRDKTLTDFASRLDHWSAIRSIAHAINVILYTQDKTIYFVDFTQEQIAKRKSEGRTEDDIAAEKRRNPVTKISRATGLIGYPKYMAQMYSVDVLFSELFLPNINVMLDVPEVDINEEICCITNVKVQLSSEVPSSQWKTTLSLLRYHPLFN